MQPAPIATEREDRSAFLREEARRYMAAAAPHTPHAHLFETALGGHVFVADGSRLFDADADLFAELRLARGDAGITGVLGRLGLDGPPRIDDQPLTDPPLHALSLAIAQKCNLGCTYCYAQQGEFGGGRPRT